MTSTFNVVARYRTMEGKTNEVLEHLHRLAEASRSEIGNLSYDFFRGVQDDRAIVILESYSSENDFDQHRASEHFHDIGAGRIIPLLESRTVSTYLSGN